MMNVNTLVFIGRFQPFHDGHAAALSKAIEQTGAKNVIFVLGSARAPRTSKNPLTVQERAKIIGEYLKDGLGDTHPPSSVYILAQADHPYNHDKWVSEIEYKVSETVKDFSIGGEVGLIVSKKDHSSWYQDTFTQFVPVRVELDTGTDTIIDAADIRAEMYAHVEDRVFLPIPTNLPTSDKVVRELNKVIALNGGTFIELAEEHSLLNKYAESWKNSPYPPTFVTVDAVMVFEDNILLIQRKHNPGKGLWALPGGFIDSTETLQESVIREVHEETGFKIVPNGNCSMKTPVTFDNPSRSSRGRTITHVFEVDLSAYSLSEPVIQAGDDAATYAWVHIEDLRSEDMFEDHYHIIQKVLGLE